MGKNKNKYKNKIQVPVTDVVYYINLEKRIDRKILVEKELKKIFDNFNRIPAENGDEYNISNKISGAVGCAYSHIKALEMGLENGAENIFIFEDDFQLEVSTSLAKDMIKYIKEVNFNLILLSYHMPLVKLTNLKKHLADIENGQTTCSYVVKRNSAQELINLFKKSVEGLIETESLDDWSIDQSWKALQTPVNKTYGLIPRLGKQRQDYSDILKLNVDYGGACFMGILSCEKFLSRRQKQDLKNCPFQYKYFIGKPNIGSPIVKGNIVYLPCGDNYEDLSDKTHQMLKWILSNNESIDYIFKTDDDIKFNFELLISLYSEIVLRKLDYAGNYIHSDGEKTEYHYGKCFDKKKEIMISLKAADYCSGGGYFLSKSASQIILTEMNRHKTMFEDFSVGKTLNENNIFPVSINIKGNACFW